MSCIFRSVCFIAAGGLPLAMSCLFINSWAGAALAAPPAEIATKFSPAAVWCDEFDGASLDESKWVYRGLGPRRSAINVKDAVSVGAGNLAITTFTADGKHYTGMIATRDRFEQKFGYFEARIKFQSSPGMWSAFWMWSSPMTFTEGIAAEVGAEIDIQEHCCIDNAGKDIRNRCMTTVHWNGYEKNHQYRTHNADVPGLGEGFHLYGLAWDANGYRFYVDGKQVWTLTDPASISKHSEYIILSSEVQNMCLAGAVSKTGYGPRSSSTTKMIVDCVRVYSLVPDESLHPPVSHR